MKRRKAIPEAVSTAKPAAPMKLYLVRHPEYGQITVNGRTKYEAVLAASREWKKPWSRLARECEFTVLAEESEVERRSCENCGNTACANSLVAFFWDECVESKFTKHWRPKK